MSRRTHNAMYFADDKDIQDLLLSAKRNLSLERLLQLARKRGIYLSRDYPRERVIDFLQCLPYNWPQLRELVEATDTPDRPRRSTYTEVHGEISDQAIQRSLDQLRIERNTSRAEALQFSTSKAGNFSIGVEYSELDPSKTRLFQRKQRSLRIEIERDSAGIRVRHEDTPRAQEIVQALLSTVIESPEKTPIDRIDLSAIKEPRLRSEFFVHLMTKMAGFRLEDVRLMDVATIPTQQADEDDDEHHSDDGTASESGSEPDDDSDVEQRLSPDQKQLVGIVKQAALKGSNLLQSPEYERFKRSGFFISRSSWSAIEDIGENRRVEFDARFSDPRNAAQFNYGVVSVYEPMKNGRFRRLPPSAVKDRDLCRLLEDTARQAAEDVKREFGTQSPPTGT